MRVHDDGPAPGGVGRTDPRSVRRLAVRVSGRRMFSDLSAAERRELVDGAVDAYRHTWGPAGLPADLEAWLAVGMYAAMMQAYCEQRMLRRAVPRPAATTLEGQLEHWLAADLLGMPAVLDLALVDRYLRQLSPADARLLWLEREGYTREEIADQLNVRPNAVSVRLHRLRIRLRDTAAPLVDPLLDSTDPQGAGFGPGRAAAGGSGSGGSGSGAVPPPRQPPAS
jgi:DNA-binding CsgD family transcriptional regulator